VRIALSVAMFAMLAACTTTTRYTERVKLIDPSAGERATQTCSRAGPENPSRFFSPSPREVTAIETAAMRLLRERADDYADLIGERDIVDPFDWPGDPSLYQRHYIGYYEDGRRMIYGSYFPAGDSPFPDEPLVICDGGYQFFGVEYDLDAQSVRRIAFDGSRGGPVLPPIEPRP
jgi:hypothetical protein